MGHYIDINVFYVFLISHLLGDFYFQSNKMAECKNNEYKSVLKHSAIYMIPFVLVAGAYMLIFGWKLWTIVAIAGNIIAHWVIDSCKYLVIKKQSNLEKRVYIVDQLLHIAVLAVTSARFIHGDLFISETAAKILLHLTFFVLLLKPANITFMKLYGSFRLTDKEHSKDNNFVGFENKNNENMGTPGAGRIIGNFERLLCGIFILLGQYEALGLTIAAKSIARYDKISNDAAFSEYYIIGTLFSVLYAIVVYFLLFHIL